MKKNRYYLLVALSFCYLAIQLLYSWSQQPYSNLESKIPWSEIFTNIPFLLDGALLLFSLIIVHLLFAWVIWQIQLRLFTLTQSQKILSLPSTLLIFTWLVLTAAWFNQQLYPYSIFAYATSPVTSSPVVNLLAPAGIVAAFTSVTWRFAEIAQRSKTIVAVATVVFLLAYFFTNYSSILHAKNTRSDVEKPNIILIGIDSMRASAIEEAAELGIPLPNLSRFVDSAIRFTDAITPLARTFPAWVSILTGKDPIDHGARFNLTNLSSIDIEDTIAKRLQNSGYSTLYATDEKRFSNIDENFGFDSVVGPRIGVSDFIFGSLNDFVLTNLLVNTSIGAYLFPFSHANRAVARLYDPESFNRLVDHKIESLSSSGNFIAVHFCLPHWPYRWKNTTDGVSGGAYYASLIEADRQFGHLMKTLQNRGILDHALFILLSDHGEGIGSALDSIESTDGEESVTLMNGHGTNTLSEGQNRVLLAMRKFDDAPQAESIINRPVSLIDIYPTIVDYIGDTSIETSNSLLNPKTPLVSHRYRFLENGLNAKSLQLFTSGKISVNDLLQETLEYYSLADDGRLSLKQVAIEHHLQVKQRAVIYQRWNLTQVIAPQGKSTLFFLDRDSNSITHVTPSMKQTEPIHSMLTQLCQHYGEDHGFSLDDCDSSQ